MVWLLLIEAPALSDPAYKPISGTGATITPLIGKTKIPSSVSSLVMVISAVKLPTVDPDKVTMKVSVTPGAMLLIELLMENEASLEVISEMDRSAVPVFSIAKVCTRSLP